MKIKDLHLRYSGSLCMLLGLIGALLFKDTTSANLGSFLFLLFIVGVILIFVSFRKAKDKYIRKSSKVNMYLFPISIILSLISVILLELDQFWIALILLLVVVVILIGFKVDFLITVSKLIKQLIKKK